MSARVSTTSSASAGANSTGAKPAAPAGAAAAGNAGSEGVNAAAAARGASGAGAGAAPGTNPGPAARFSSAMAEAVQAGDQAAIAQLRDSKQANPGHTTDTNSAHANPDTDQRTRELSAPEVERSAAAAAIASAHENSAKALPTAGAKTADSNGGALGPLGNARGGRTGGKPGGARAAGRDEALTATTDPVALAMLLAASAMPLSSTPVHVADGRQPALAAGGAAVDLTAGRSTVGATAAAGDANALAVSASAQRQQSAQPARAAPPAALEAASSAGTAGTGLPGAPDPLPGKAESSDSSAGQPAIMLGSAGLPDLVRSVAHTSTQTPLVEATISVPLASGGWPHAVAAQVHWFVNNDVHSATLRLSPEHLGPVEVHIDVRHSQVNVNFCAAHAETRAALEQTVPRLREIFASGGLTLGQANVQQDPRPGSQASAVPVRSAFSHAQTVEPVAVAAAQALGLVDEYA